MDKNSKSIKSAGASLRKMGDCLQKKYETNKKYSSTSSSSSSSSYKNKTSYSGTSKTKKNGK